MMRNMFGAAKTTGRLKAYEPAIDPAGYILHYCPDGLYNDGNTMPLMVVYGDEGFTEQTALLALDKSGFAALAADANCNVVFMSPVNGTWSEADRDLYLAMVSNLHHDFGGENGIMQRRNFFTGEPEGKRLVASESQIFVFAEGKGADFVAEYLVGDGVMRTQPDGYVASYYPAGVMLSNTTATPKTGSLGMPAYLVNGTATQAEAFTASLQVERENTRLVVSAESEIKNGFDPAQVMAAWQQVFFHLRRKDNGSGAELYAIPDYDDFVTTDETVELSAGPVRYLMFQPKAFDMNQTAAYALVMGFHGGGNSALFHAWCSELPELGADEGFVTVTVDQYNKYTAAQLVELLDYLLAKNPALDAGKVYATGFSMGSGKTWDLGLCQTKRFAGIAPVDGCGNVPEDTMVSLGGEPIDFDTIIPTCYVAGELDPLGVGPNQKTAGGEIATGCNRIMNVLFRKNGTPRYEFDPTGDYFWGLHSETDTIVDGKLTAVTHYVPNPDGVVYAAFCNVVGQTHVQTSVAVRAAWKFLKKFRRAADGSVVIEA